MTGKTEELLGAAVQWVEPSESKLGGAVVDVLRAGLLWIGEYEAEPLVYRDGRTAGADRMFKLTPEGRATIALAEAVLEEW